MGIDGKWTGVVEGIDGRELELIYEFKTDGPILKGSIKSRLGGGEILSGRIDGNSISFTLNAGNYIIVNKGIITNDSIEITEEFEGKVINLTLKRIKTK